MSHDSPFGPPRLGLVRRGRELPDVLRDDADVLEDARDLRVRVAGDLLDVEQRLANDLAVLADGLVQRVRRVGHVLQDDLDVVAALLGADARGELLGDGLDAVGDLLDLLHEVGGRRLGHDDMDLVPVDEMTAVRRARREDDDGLPEERGALLAERAVLVEVDVLLHLDVEARLPVLQPDRLERADGDARDGDARALREDPWRP